MEQWQIQKTEGRCAGTDKELQPGEEYYAALIDNETEFVRKDYCVQYWDENKPKVFSYWKTMIAPPNEKKKLFVDNQVLVNFFERLAQEKDNLKLNFRFVLTLILMRKRLVKYIDTKIVDGKEIWTVQLMADKNMHDVINPHLNDEQIEEVSKELSVILQGEL